MSTEKGFLLCENPEPTKWQLTSPPQGNLWILGWRRMPEYEIEGGVPDEVAEILAKSLTSRALVTFPSIESAPGIGIAGSRFFTNPGCFQSYIYNQARIC
jgi:hypothetical protein